MSAVTCCLTAAALVRVESYDAFTSTMSIFVGSDPSVQQLAVFYQLSRDAVVAAASSEMSSRLGNWIKTYYREKFAPWVVRQHGLVSS